MSSPPRIVWFRRDLRLADHRPLAAACAAGPVVCVWVCDPTLLAKRHHQSPQRRAFLRAGLESLNTELIARGSRLIVRAGDPAEALVALARETGASAVDWYAEVSPYGVDRDHRVAAALTANGINPQQWGLDLIAQPSEIPGPKDLGYQVFTPFSRKWMECEIPAHLPAPERITSVECASDGLDLLGNDPSPLPAGPDAARAALVQFIADGHADHYHEMRNTMSADGTSHLSSYLRFGMCSPSQIGRALGLPGALSDGRAAFWRQICWREFYHHHMARNSYVARQAFKPAFRDIAWSGTHEDLTAWTHGRTGYPIVDAGMRQLRAQGWMHNRTRMITASFLVKDLAIDWRVGETIFMHHLIDGDPANNNGGWQWTAGTGTDASPYYRIFNPVLQSKRFDPEGDYIRRWVPELSRVPTSMIHEPWHMNEDQQAASACVLGQDYPWPIIDHAERRDLILEIYRAAEQFTLRDTPSDTDQATDKP